MRNPFSQLIVLITSLFLFSSCGIFRSASDQLSKRPDRSVQKSGIKPYKSVITGEAKTNHGVLDVHYVNNDIFYEIPDSLFGRNLLMVSRIAKVPSEFFGFFSSGSKTAEQVFTFEKVNDKVNIRRKSYNSVAADSLPISRSVKANNYEPIIASFEIEAIGPDASSTVIKVNDFFEDDVPAISGLISFLRSNYQVRRLDKNRSYIDTVRTFPKNIEARHVMTYEAMNPPSAENTNTISVLMNQSMVLLPKEPMKPRLADHRVGWFTVEQLDFGLDEQKAATRKYIRRWRLEPSDPEAYARGELTEPVNPIIFYLDPATPNEYRKFVKMGVEDWNTAFKEAGFKNAIIARDAPAPEEDPDFEPEDIRYNMVRWIANTTRNAVGPSTTDPRTGEIIASDIIWFHNHIRSYRNRLMIETGAANPKARSLKLDIDYIGEAIRQVIAHEIGHALGLPHNMKANSAYPVDSLRSPAFTEEFGVSASIMDYARQNYIAQPGDGVERFIRKIGPYDKYAINWGYRIIPDAKGPDDEKTTLDRWILEKAGNPMYRFGSYTGYDPSAQTETLSDDPVQASIYGMMNLQRVVPNLIEWTSRPGEGYDDLEEIYGELVSQWNRYVNHVITNIGGVYRERKSTNQEGNVYRPVSKDYQKKAIQFMNEHAFSTPYWLLNEALLRKIEHAGAIERIQSLQGSHLRNVLSVSRMNRLIEDETFRGSDAYTLSGLLNDVRAGVWSEINENAPVDPYRRNIQRIYVSHIESIMNSNETPANISDIKPLLRNELEILRDTISGVINGVDDRLTEMHLKDIAKRIENILDPK